MAHSKGRVGGLWWTSSQAQLCSGLQEVLLLETQSTNGGALEIHVAKAFCHSTIRKPIWQVLWPLVLLAHVKCASLADVLHKQELLPHNGARWSCLPQMQCLPSNILP